MNTSITDKLPIDSITGPVTDSVHRVGELVPDHVPDVVVGAVNDGVAQGRRFGRGLAGRLPGTSRSSSTKRWAILATVLALAGVALVVWRVRTTRDQGASDARDSWSTNASSGTTDRVVA